jgi:hypothetical protein
MRVGGAILGILNGFRVGVIFTEWLFQSGESWFDAVPVVLAVLGGLTGGALGRRATARRAGAAPV